MKYVMKTIQGVIEIREDNRTVVPPGAMELTDAQYEQVCAQLMIYDGVGIIKNPNPPKIL